MYAVIFTAELDQLDSDYEATAQRMRELAFSDFGCLKFSSCQEGGLEIAISYWQDEQHIKAWRQHTEHLKAQLTGRQRWYKRYDVEVMKMIRSYRFDSKDET